MKFIPQYYDIICVTQYTNGTKSVETALSWLTFEECQETLTKLFGYTPHRIIEVEGIGKVCIEGFSVNRAYECMPACPEEEKVYFCIRKMKK